MCVQLDDAFLFNYFYVINTRNVIFIGKAAMVFKCMFLLIDMTSYGVTGGFTT